MRNILVIEDDSDLIKLFKHEFDKDLSTNFIYASTYSDGMAQVFKMKFDLYIIDINLGEYSGLDILKVLQKEKNIDNRVMVMSATDKDNLRIEAYNLGASNYLVKPFKMSLLVSILKKNIRSLDNKDGGTIFFSKLQVSPSTRSCFIKNNNKNVEIQLTYIEFNLLYKLVLSPNLIISKEDLSYLGKDRNEPMSFKTIEMHIASIRKKIGEDMIVTKKSAGYYFQD